jgi:hypothetical protein
MSGNVGIGTTIPQGGLVVTNGNVGIGTVSPKAKFEVDGMAYLNNPTATELAFNSSGAV